MARGMYRVSSDYAWSLSVSCSSRRCVARLKGTDLVEKDVLPIPSLGRKVLQIPVLIDSMLLTQLLPELRANCEAVLAAVSSRMQGGMASFKQVLHAAWVIEKVLGRVAYRCYRIGPLGGL